MTVKYIRREIDSTKSVISRSVHKKGSIQQGELFHSGTYPDYVPLLGTFLVGCSNKATPRCSKTNVVHVARFATTKVLGSPFGFF